MTSWVNQLAAAIQHREGFSPGTRSYRNNNPGNLRPPNGSATYWTGQTGVDSGGFAVFGSYEDGWNALLTNLSVHAQKNPDQTIGDYFQQYAPASDGNDPVAYAAFVANQLGVDPDTTLGDLSAGA